MVSLSENLSSSSACDVLIIGAGPVGTTLAGLLRTLNEDINICVVDKRELPTRNHGLFIKSESIDKVDEIVQQALQSHPNVSTNDSTFLSLLHSWKDRNVRTNTIENILGEAAKNNGITLMRNNAFAPVITVDKLESLFKKEQGPTFSSEHQQFKDFFDNAQIIIGADGSHSTTREVMQGKLLDQATLQFVVELKLQANRETKPRDYLDAASEFFNYGVLDSETMSSNPDNGDPYKPVAFHMLVDKDTYDKLHVQNAQGEVLKGSHANYWQIDEIKKMGENDNALNYLYQVLSHYLTGVEARGGHWKDERIAALPLTTYRSEKAAELYHGKVVSLVGDADSGLVLREGFNKGLEEAALLARAIDLFFRRNRPLGTVLPNEFQEYQISVQDLFNQKIRKIKRRSFAIDVLKYFFDFIKETLFPENPDLKGKELASYLETGLQKYRRGTFLVEIVHLSTSEGVTKQLNGSWASTFKCIHAASKLGLHPLILSKWMPYLIPKYRIKLQMHLAENYASSSIVAKGSMWVSLMVQFTSLTDKLVKSLIKSYVPAKMHRKADYLWNRIKEGFRLVNQGVILGEAASNVGSLWQKHQIKKLLIPHYNLSPLLTLINTTSTVCSLAQNLGNLSGPLDAISQSSYLNERVAKKIKHLSVRMNDIQNFSKDNHYINAIQSDRFVFSVSIVSLFQKYIDFPINIANKFLKTSSSTMKKVVFVSSIALLAYNAWQAFFESKSACLQRENKNSLQK